ncbi:hypothetical protein AMJ80_06460 [bacterium SM23_31]|nr:MAG: hypothetical protein AMJ80_06460 [bacterium SM23_31]
MPEIGTEINLLRSLVFIRKSSNRIIEKTGTRVRKTKGNLKLTAIDTELTPRRIRFNTYNRFLNVQKNKNPQDRFIDMFV